MSVVVLDSEPDGVEDPYDSTQTWSAFWKLADKKLPKLVTLLCMDSEVAVKIDAKVEYKGEEGKGSVDFEVF